MPETLFLIDGPFVSEYLKQAITKFKIPVVKTPEAVKHLENGVINYIDTEAAKLKLLNNPQTKVYTNSENALDWVYQNHPDRQLIRALQLSKDKVRFRQVMQDLTPEFYFKAVSLDALPAIDPVTIPFPVILKPAVGFFSLGVHGVQDQDGWKKALASIENTIDDMQDLYPESVLDNSMFIIEELIDGHEYAIDCLFGQDGKPIIFNIMKHMFASDQDMNDRVYITSQRIMEEQLPSIEKYLKQVGELFGFKGFPAHIELRIKDNGDMNIIEINPLRFGGWCSTPDLAQYAWGFNVYEYLIKGIKPDWTQLLKQRGKETYSLIVLNNSTGVKGVDIDSFDYNLLLSRFDHPLELRKTDFKRFPLFGFLMCEVTENRMESLQEILHSDLLDFIRVNN
ncbi:MAG: ATP-grasp domain-containing protein [Candidatus Marinimicrobia bacterium]|nr:ATP-grasp domain-containing protein [Candidatus Neomarinimicrobiota bacterium]MCF7903567.1 ATP-grasp domain-containing protein [Candidatus Neomarinimicrobiota bacterium]